MRRYKEWAICGMLGAMLGLYGMARLCEKELLKKRRTGCQKRSKCKDCMQMDKDDTKRQENKRLF